MNNRGGKDFVMERLDKAFAGVGWVNSYPYYAHKNYPIYHSDHGPIILDFELQHPFGKRLFRFERMWLNHPDCQDMIQKAWSIHTSRSRAAQLRNKLCNLRIEVVEWNKIVFWQSGE